MKNKVESANEFRQLIHGQQQSVLKDLSFEKITKAIYENGDLSAISELSLTCLRDVLGVEHSLIAENQDASLVIIATHGKTYPRGARIPKISRLADTLKSPLVFDIQPIPANQLFTLSESISGQAYAVPLSVAGNPRGILAYFVRDPISKEHLGFLQVIASTLSLSMQKKGASVDKADKKILALITPREREVLALLPKGYTNNEIAEKLNIAPGTVKVHIEHILSKLSLKDRTQAAVRASELGL